MIKICTLTGADDHTSIEDLNMLAYKYPFVEFGILVSRNSMGNYRFPSKKWIENLKQEGHENLKLSCHLCGAYVRELLLGNSDFITKELFDFWDMFGRVQINTHGQKHKHNKDFVKIMNLYSEKEFVFQYDDVNQEILTEAINGGVNCSTLFDLSHGAGVLPEQWPKPISDIKCGYAGGLSVENLEDQIQLIEGLVGDTEIWIDAETHLRSDDNKIFDIQKCDKFLEITSKYVKK